MFAATGDPECRPPSPGTRARKTTATTRSGMHLDVEPSLEIAVEALGLEHRPAAATIFEAAHPERADEFHREPAGGSATRWVAVVAAEVVGFAALWCVHDDRFRIDVVVAASRRGRGVGSRLLQHVVGAARTDGAATVQARTGSD